jgi:hypothetical protein
MRISTIKQRGDHHMVLRRRNYQPYSVIKKSMAAPTITPHFFDAIESDKLVVDCSAGIAQIKIVNGKDVKMMNYDHSRTGAKTESIAFDLNEFDRSVPLYVGVLGCNGLITRIQSVWRMVHRAPVRIDDSDIILSKQSVMASDPEHGHQWTVMLNEKGADGKLSRAKKIDLRVGAVLDGAVVYYEDRHTTPCGYRYYGDGSTFRMGGGNSQMLTIPDGVEIVKVEVNMRGWTGILGGISMSLSDGTRVGVLNGVADVRVLQPGVGQKIVGFFGTTQSYTQEFGIITAPDDVELPLQTYDMPQLQNLQKKGCMSNR